MLMRKHIKVHSIHHTNDQYITEAEYKDNLLSETAMRYRKLKTTKNVIKWLEYKKSQMTNTMKIKVVEDLIKKLELSK